MRKSEESFYYPSSGAGQISDTRSRIASRSKGSVADEILRKASSKPRSANVHPLMQYAENINSDLHSSDKYTCEWCHRPYKAIGGQKVHEASTAPRWSIPEGRYICERRTLSANSTELSGSDRHGNLGAGHHGATRTLGGDTQAGALFECAVIACGETYPTRALLEYHESVEHEKLSPNKHAIPTLDLGSQGSQDGGSDGDEEDDEGDGLGPLINGRDADADAMLSLYGTSMPFGGSFASSFHAASMTPRFSSRKQNLSLPSPKTFVTAQSSLQTFVTAPSNSNLNRTRLITKRSLRAKDRHKTAYDEMINDVTAHILGQLHEDARSSLLAAQQEDKVRNLIQGALSSISPGGADDWQVPPLNVHILTLLERLVTKLSEFDIEGSRSGTVKLLDLKNELESSALKAYIESRVCQYFDARMAMNNIGVPDTVFSSEWLAHLSVRGILLNPREELDWSGKGQHVEYTPEEERKIPLKSEKILGHSHTAIVESVRCRRIRLARKMIACSRQLKKEDAITEVEHLLRLQHTHIVRVVGTYTLKRHLAILLYPVADCDLDRFLNDQLDASDPTLKCSTNTIERFFGCLSSATAFIHEHNTKHMDIKPKNFLVRHTSVDYYAVYIADFGIARSYQSSSESETDSPISFTRTYAAPEVVLQDTRGFSADIFSLGCVFMEMMATIYTLSTPGVSDERQRLLDLRKEGSGNLAFYANIDRVVKWFEDTIRPQMHTRDDSRLGRSRLMDLCPQMLSEAPSMRPSSSDLKECTAWISCRLCDAGPEPFEAAK